MERRSDIYTYKHAQRRNEGDDLKQPPEGEEDVPKHCEVMLQRRWRLMRRCRQARLGIPAG